MDRKIPIEVKLSLIVFIIFLVLYIIVIAISFHTRRFIFAPYQPKELSNSFKPLQKVVELPPAMQVCRAKLYTSGTELTEECKQTIREWNASNPFGNN